MPCKYPKYRKNAGCVVACGQCKPCVLKKQREKCARVLLEDRNASRDVLFVTLSYDNNHLPTDYVAIVKDPDNPNGRKPVFYSCPTGTLNPDHIVNFMKKVRYYAGERKLTNIRAVYAGEYGDEKLRPHYHLIIWGIPYKEREIFFKSWTDKNKQLMCDPKRLDVQIPKNTRHLANYCSKYIINGKNSKTSPLLNGAYPEFYRTSKGLGLQYAEGVANALKKESGLINLWADGKIPSSFFFDGKNYPLDRYLKGKIYALLPSVFAEEIPKAALEDYKEEMFAVYSAALDDEDFLSQTIDMGITEQMEFAVRRMNARRATECEQKHSFFASKRRNLDV